MLLLRFFTLLFEPIAFYATDAATRVLSREKFFFQVYAHARDMMASRHYYDARLFA